MIYYLKRYWKYILIVSIIIFILIGIYIYNDNTNDVSTTNVVKLADSVDLNQDEKKQENVVKTVFVDVKGAVNAPGVYEIDEGRRIIDAINLAGGLTDKSDTINLNLSKKVEDEMYIIVYTKDEIYNYKLNNEQSNEKIVCASVECDCPNVNNDACIKEESNSSSEKVSKISINTATKEELMELSGIGESKADAIISYRNENGNFENIEDIKNVSGIGNSVYEKIKDEITL